jgi:hypothetical protein
MKAWGASPRDRCPRGFALKAHQIAFRRISFKSRRAGCMGAMCLLSFHRAAGWNQQVEGHALDHRLMRLQRNSAWPAISSWGLHPRLSSCRAFGALTRNEKPETRDQKLGEAEKKTPPTGRSYRNTNDKNDLRNKAELYLSAFRRGFGLSPGFLRRSFEGAQSANLFHDSLSIQLVFQALQRAIDGFPFSYDNFRHIKSVILSVL